MDMDDGEKLMNLTIAGTIAMCVGFLMLFLQAWVWCGVSFILFVVLFKLARGLQQEIDWNGEWIELDEKENIPTDQFDDRHQVYDYNPLWLRHHYGINFEKTFIEEDRHEDK